MNSLRDPAQNAAILRRLDSMRENVAPRWGKMDAGQMMAHCQAPFDVASGALTLKRGLIGKLFGGYAKKKFIRGGAPFSNNSPTDPKFRVTDQRDFSAERTRLREQIVEYAETGAISKDPHPFFGELTDADWDYLLWKHLDHHLRQFGV